MWDIKEIKNKKNKIIKELRSCNDNKRSEKLKITLAGYVSMLDNSGTIRYTKFYNLMDKITRGQFTLIKPSTKLIIKGEELINESKDYMDLDYLSFLLELVKNISNTKAVVYDDEKDSFKRFNFSNDDLVKISKLFYLNLGDQEIYECAKKIIEDELALNFTNEYVDNLKHALGITFYDYIDNRAYCTTIRNNNLFDLQANNHEIMHATDFYMKPKVPTENYYGFHEVPTYFIDYLFIDYLENLQIDSNEVQKLRLEKDHYLQNLAINTDFLIRNQLAKKKGTICYFGEIIPVEVMEIMNTNILKNLLEIESGVISYGLSKQFEGDNELGIKNLKTFMKTMIPKDKRPNFSIIGLNDKKLLELSLEIGSYSKKYETTKEIVK